jgi:hypothetical protein
MEQMRRSQEEQRKADEVETQFVFQSMHTIALLGGAQGKDGVGEAQEGGRA